MNNLNKLIICILGDCYMPPDLDTKLRYIFSTTIEIEFFIDYVELGEPDYIIGDFIAEYSIKNLIEKIQSRINNNVNNIIIGFINESIERNFFSHLIISEKTSIISLKDIEEYGVELEKYILLSIVEHYIVHTTRELDWHFESKRCLFDFCADKKNIANSSKYLALCNVCKSKIDDNGKVIINKVIEVLTNKMTQTSILFLSANPIGSTLRLDDEMRDVEHHVTRVAKYRDEFSFRKLVATRIIDLQQEMLEKTPTIVHFAGHGNENGIYFNDESGKHKLVKTEPLAEYFASYSDKVKCVFLNSCYSEYQALEINKYISFVIGMSRAVPDEVAIQFAISFYQSLAAGKDIVFSFNIAKNSLSLYNLQGANIPILHIKKE